MYCPKCGHEQGVEDVRFCSRCGFSLVEVTSLIERGETTGALTATAAPRERGVRQAMYFLVAALPLLALALAAGLADFDGVPEIFGLLAMLTFLIGTLRLIYAVAFAGRRSGSVTTPLGQQTGRVNALPPYAPPVGFPEARFDTGETVEPPSVTEHTTRRLERELPRERER